MEEQFSNLGAPSNITHEYLEFGNLFKLKWAPVEEAGAYVIQRLNGNNFSTVAVVLKNEFVDYEVAGFSYDEVISYTYRIATLRITEQTPDKFSTNYPVALNFVPEIIARQTKFIEDSNSDVLHVIFNKEMKVLVQDSQEKLDFYKYSAMDNRKDVFLEPFYSYNINSAPDFVEQIVDNNDDDFIFVKYKNSNVIALSANDLSRKLTISDFFGSTTGKMEVDFKNNIFGIVDSNHTSISLLKIIGNVTVRLGEPIKIELGKEKNILDFNIINSRLFILDYYGRLHIYDINNDLETVTKFQTFFEDEDLINNYDSFYKRSFLIKNLIDQCAYEFNNTLFQDGLTTEELANFKTFFLGRRDSETYNESTGNTSLSPDPIKPILKAFSVFLNDSAYSSLNDLSVVLNEAKNVLDQLFNLYLTDTYFTIDKPSSVKINALKNYVKNSEYLLFWAKRTVASFEKYVSYEARYLKETKIIHSELNNQLILIGPYFYKILDLNIYKMQNYFHTFFASGSLKNQAILDMISGTDFTLNADDTDTVRLAKNYKRAVSFDKIDRFIDAYDTNKELESLGVTFEDLRFEYYYDKSENEIIEQFCFSEKYLDLYKVNFSSVFDPKDVDFTFTFFSGFGFDSVFVYSNAIAINKGSYYFYGGSGYRCLKNRLRSVRELVPTSELILFELENGYLEKINGDFFNSLNLTTRVFYTSKKTEFIEPRVFSLFSDIVVEAVSDQTGKFDFLNGKELYDSSMLSVHENINVKSKIDNFNDTVLFVSLGAELGVGLGYRTIASLTTFHNFYVDTYFTLNEEFSLKRARYSGATLFGDLKAADDPGVFFIGYEDHSTNELFISVFSLFAETFTLDSFKKIKISSKNVYYDLVYSYWTKYNRTIQKGEKKDFLIFNDAKTSVEQYQEIYGNQEQVVWRWERNKEVLAEEDYSSFRVSINKSKWVYLNKNIRSYSFGDTLGDGMHKFYLQYQDKKGVWSDSIICKYYLKTIKPSTPVLSKIERADGDNSKPVFYWTSEPDTSYFKITYNKKIEYTTVNNYHSPDEAFVSYNKYETIPINVISYDKFGNQSEPANWLFTAKAKFDKKIELNYEKFTGNKNPVVTWKTVRDSSSVSKVFYRFDNSPWKETEDAFFKCDFELEDGAHFFEFYFLDSLDNKSDLEIYYFEVNSKPTNAPVLTEETIQRTRKCSLKNLYFHFDYQQSSFRMFYSFDNFRTENEFFGFFLDLTNKKIKPGHKTISFRFLDKFNNYSEPLEYSFTLNEKEISEPTFFAVDARTSNLRPIWKWSNSNEAVFNILKLKKNNLIVYENSQFFDSYFIPSFDLGDGFYSLELISVDSFGNFATPIEYTLEIDTRMPKKPVLKNRTSKNGLYSFEFESPSTDELIYFKLIDLNDVGRFENNLYTALNSNNSVTVLLKENKNFVVVCKTLGSNSLWSEELRIVFSTAPSSYSETRFSINVGDYFFNFDYSELNGNIKIPKGVTDNSFSLSGNFVDSIDSTLDEFEFIVDEGVVLIEES